VFDDVFVEVFVVVMTPFAHAVVWLDCEDFSSLFVDDFSATFPEAPHAALGVEDVFVVCL